jgi:hypothetical protein
MEESVKKTFIRQMYTGDSEIGKMKLQAVKENLYEASTKVVLYSIEMYAKKELGDWVKTDLLLRLDKLNGSLKRSQYEFEEGQISKLDITNGCAVINDFVRKDALDKSRKELQAKMELQRKLIATLDEKSELIAKRIVELQNEPVLENVEVPEDDETREVGDFFEEESIRDSNEDLDENLDEEDDENDEEYDETEDDEDLKPASEIDLFIEQISAINDFDELEGLDEDVRNQRQAADEMLMSLAELTSAGKDLLTQQSNSEKSTLENLRTLRNTGYAHFVDDDFEISQIGSWEPEAGPLYQWASEILNYLRVIDARYRTYAIFDDYYFTKEWKGKFDSCKVYVQRQIKELYVNRSSVVFEFAGDLYDKEDEVYNFNKLIKNMARSWNTGIRYLTVVTNEDLPELNVFFKECLSGTNKYVDFYLMDRNALRSACKKNDYDMADYIYFKFLYHLNPSMDKIYWKDKSYSQNDFAKSILYKIIRVKNVYQFEARLNDCDKYFEGMDIKKWCEYHLLSEGYFAGKDDQTGVEKAQTMENAIINYCNNSKSRTSMLRKVLRSAVNLYFHMDTEHVFFYARGNGQKLRWKNLEAARKYMENGQNFKSYNEICSLINELNKSEYFKIWKSLSEVQ